MSREHKFVGFDSRQEQGKIERAEALVEGAVTKMREIESLVAVDNLIEGIQSAGPGDFALENAKLLVFSLEMNRLIEIAEKPKGSTATPSVELVSNRLPTIERLNSVLGNLSEIDASSNQRLRSVRELFSELVDSVRTVHELADGESS